MSVRVEVSEPVLAAPQLLSFPRGVPFANDSDTAGPLISVYRKGSGRKQKGAVVFASSAVTYKGCDFAERGNDSRAASCRYAIAVYDGGDVLRVLPAPHAYVMRPEFAGMQNHPEVCPSPSFLPPFFLPFTRSRLTASLVSSAKAPIRLSSMTAQERRESRTEEFASSKKKRAVKASQSNSILSENIAGAAAMESAVSRTCAAALESAVSEHCESMQLARDEASAELQDGGDTALEKQRRENLPYFDLQATEAGDVYPFDRLIPASVLDKVEKFYDSTVDAAQEAEGEAEQSARALRAWMERLREQQAPELALGALRDRLHSLQKAAGKEKRVKSSNRPAAVRALVVKVLLLCWGVKYHCLVRPTTHISPHVLTETSSAVLITHQLRADRNLSVRKEDLRKELAALGAPPEAAQLFGERYGRFKRVKGHGVYQAAREDMFVRPPHDLSRIASTPFVPLLD